MRFYSQQHPYYCGVDLHTRMMFCCIVDADGQIVEHTNLPTPEHRFLKLIEPYRDGLVVGVECMFSWYWLADLCERESIDFVLGHVCYVVAHRLLPVNPDSVIDACGFHSAYIDINDAVSQT